MSDFTHLQILHVVRTLVAREAERNAVRDRVRLHMSEHVQDVLWPLNLPLYEATRNVCNPEVYS
jgi:hypothetical protein